MRRERAVLEDAVESLADGAEIDWASLEGRLGNAGERRVLEQLKVLARIAEVHRSQASEPDEPVFRTRSFGGKVIPIHGHHPAEAAPGAPPLAGGPASRLDNTPADPDVAPGARWGHLELIARIGEGTFGEVYRALDTQLDREVAVKLLRVGVGVPADRQTRRVLREGRILARVEHDNVVQVYGAETHDDRVGLWMELIRGETLEQLLREHGPFSAREAALIGQDLCSAVAAVHNAGLVHRDIKTQNVMREEGGRVVLMDFGAGQLTGEPRAEAVSTPQGPGLRIGGPASRVPSLGVAATRAIAGDGRLTGTPLYLAPEVLAGGEFTPQADIYSIGVLLYRLVTGDYPVRAGSMQELREAQAAGRRVHLHDARPELPAGLIRVIERALESDTSRRYATAGAMRAALDRVLVASEGTSDVVERVPVPARPYRFAQMRTRTLAAAMAAGVGGLALAGMLVWQSLRGQTTASAGDQPQVVAVLDLARGDGVGEYEAAGITEGIQDLLSSTDAVRVVSRRSVRAASQGDPSTTVLAKQLGADVLVDGRIDHAQGGSLVTLRLIRAGSDHSIALGTFTAPQQKPAALLLPAAQATARALGVRLPAAVGERSRSAQDLAAEAHDRYTRARYYLNTVAQRGHAGEAVQLFEEAIAVAPAYGEAYAGLARAKYYLATSSRGDMWTGLNEARNAGVQALALDPTLAEAHAVVGISDFYHWKWKDAEESLTRAVTLNPSNEFAAERYAYLLIARGRLTDGIARLVQLRRLDPMSPLVACSMASALHYAGRNDEALKEIQRARSLDPTDPAGLFVQGRILAAMGRYDEAIASFERTFGQSGGMRVPLTAIAAAEAAAGRREKALAMVANLETSAAQSGERLQPELVAFVYVQLGDFDRAFEWLERAADERSHRLLLLHVDPRAQPLQRDPRFAAFLARLGLPASAPANGL